MSKIKYITENILEIKQMLNEKTPLMEIARKYGVKYETLIKNLKKLGVEYTTNQHREGKPHIESRKSAMYYIENNIPISASILRRKLIEENIKECKCEKCKRIDWEGDFLPLELHHIDGNHYNNSLDNLMILCSNCHSQIHELNKVKVPNKKKTRTKVTTKEKTKIKCQKCGEYFVPKDKRQKFCSTDCFHKSQQKCDLTKEKLLKLLIEYKSFNAVQKVLGITNNALKRWCKKFDLPVYKKDLNELLDTMNNN